MLTDRTRLNPGDQVSASCYNALQADVERLKQAWIGDQVTGDRPPLFAVITGIGPTNQTTLRNPCGWIQVDYQGDGHWEITPNGLNGGYEIQGNNVILGNPAYSFNNEPPVIGATYRLYPGQDQEYLFQVGSRGGGPGSIYCYNGQGSGPIYAELTAYHAPSGNIAALYGWRQVAPDSGGYMRTVPGGFSGLPQVGGFPAVDIGAIDNNSAPYNQFYSQQLPIPSIVTLYPSCAGPYWHIASTTMAAQYQFTVYPDNSGVGGINNVNALQFDGAFLKAMQPGSGAAVKVIPQTQTLQVLTGPITVTCNNDGSFTVNATTKTITGLFTVT
jgi:hypothetical protein